LRNFSKTSPRVASDRKVEETMEDKKIVEEKAQKLPRGAEN